MTDDEESKLTSITPAERSDSELLLYDFFKHLTSLSLLTLGGVLAISQSGDKADVKPLMLMGVLVMISAGGICSFIGASEIVRKRYTGSTLHKIELYRKVAPALLAVGVGMFLGVYADSLS
jgi:hypothetical protein